jgi:hypothetical protein
MTNSIVFNNVSEPFRKLQSGRFCTISEFTYKSLMNFVLPRTHTWLFSIISSSTYILLRECEVYQNPVPEEFFSNFLRNFTAF